MRKRILVVSSANMDFVMKAAKLPGAGETLLETRGYSYVPGGKGANAAIALSRLGGDCVFCTRLGSDDNGQRLRELYIDNGIDTRFIISDKTAPTGLAAILVEDNGDNRIIVYPGANKNLNEEDVEDAITCIPDAVFLQLEIPDEAVIAAVHYANKKNIPVFMDAGPARRGYPLEKLGRLEVISPNESETYALTGIMPTGMDSCLRASFELMKRVDTKYVVLKLGGRGAYIYDGKYSRLITTYEGPVLDTTAAGDAFSAAMTLEYMNTGDIVRAVKYANVVGTMVVGKPGASSSIPNEAQVAAYMKENEIEI